MSQEKIAILDFATGGVYVYPISEREEAEDFLVRKGFQIENVEWMRGDLDIYIEK